VFRLSGSSLDSTQQFEFPGQRVNLSVISGAKSYAGHGSGRHDRSAGILNEAHWNMMLPG
jgi:hypothetical protein